MTNKHGVWIVDNRQFFNKLEALNYASKIGKNVEYQYFNNVWSNFCPTRIPTADVYKQRAEQLRQKYKYLVLNYSGGADSHNILKTFVDNNIPLDAVHVKWPMVQHNLSTTTDPTNILSEWELTIEPALKEISSQNPKIKIVHTDWADTIGYNLLDYKNFENVNHFISVGDFARMTSVSIFEKEKDVGQIWGIDKPLICVEDNRLGFYFRDETVCVGQSLDFDNNNIEFFYWSPEFPELLYSQITLIYDYLSLNKQARALFPNTSWFGLDHKTLFDRLEIKRQTLIDLLYNTWDNKFQVRKSEKQNKQDWDSWIFKDTSLANAWEFQAGDVLSSIDKRFCYVNDAGRKTALLPIKTKIFWVGVFNDNTN